MHGTKRCTACGCEKPGTEFYYGQGRCKPCICEVNRLRRQTPEYKRLAVKRVAKHKAQKRAEFDSPGMLRKRDKAWRQMVVHLKRMGDASRRAQPKMNSAELWRHRYRTDPEFRAKEIMRTFMRKTRKQYSWVSSHLSRAARGIEGGNAIWNILGYSAQELVAHLAKQFHDGMTMDHFMRGEIHIDHIIPKSTFDMDSIEDVRACHALYNLRPMWAADNTAKAAKVLTLL